MVKYRFKAGCLGCITALGLGTYTGYQGIEMAQEMMNYFSISSELITVPAKVVGSVAGFGIGGIIGGITGSFLPGGRIEKIESPLESKVLEE